jgi:septum site-determining protein MinC
MSSISFKGTRDGLCITLGEGSWRDLLDELAQQLDRPGAQSFFRGARVLLETGSRALGVVEIEELISLLAKHQMTLGSVVGENQTPGNGQSNGSTKGSSNESMPPPESFASPDGHEIADQPDAANEPPALLLRRTVRSGQVITHPGTIIIIGDINPGAEVVAGGDVIVWGRLRGVVHAGASGNESAIVGALSLTPTQLRIGGQIARAPDDRRPRTAPAEIARVRDGLIVVEPWGSLSA